MENILESSGNLESLFAILVLLVLFGPTLTICACIGRIPLSILNVFFKRPGGGKRRKDFEDITLRGRTRILVALVGTVVWIVVWILAYFIICSVFPNLPLCPTTSTPTPPSASCNLPNDFSFTIDEPLPNSMVDHVVYVAGRHVGIPSNCYLWIVAKPQDLNLYYPWEPPDVAWDGKWSITGYLGPTDGSHGQHFLIKAYLVNKEYNDWLVSYLKGACSGTGENRECRGQLRTDLPGDVIAITSVEVIRK